MPHRSTLKVAVGLPVLFIGLGAPPLAHSAARVPAAATPALPGIMASLRYTCAFPSGPATVPVNVSVQREPGSSGRRTAVRHTYMAMLLPASATRGIAASDASSRISVRAVLTASRANGDGTTSTWDSLRSAGTARPVGRALPVVAESSGGRYPGHEADGLLPGQLNLDLASAAASEAGPDIAVSCTPQTDAAEGFKPALQATTSDDCIIDTKFPGGAGQGTAIITGFSNLAKLNEATKLSQALSDIELVTEVIINLCPGDPDFMITTINDEARLDYQGKEQFPPFRSTFLTYGFMPTTATVELTETAPVEISTASHNADSEHGYPDTTTLTTRLSMRLFDVRVNGTPLDVGDHCQTVTSFAQNLHGSGVEGNGEIPPSGYAVTLGGPLYGSVDIPPFAGCGVTEDLDPVFTSAVSGLGNYTKIAQGAVCNEAEQAGVCPPVPYPGQY